MSSSIYQLEEFVVLKVLRNCIQNYKMDMTQDANCSYGQEVSGMDANGK
jgi:hypothetical protein